MTWWGGLFALAWIAAFWRWSRAWTAPLYIVVVAGFLAAIIVHPVMWPRILMGYPGDSFWTLGVSGRLGVLAISLIGLGLLFTALGLKSRRIAGRIPASIDTVINLIIFSVTYSVSPQVFYTLYLLLFDGLPHQWVISGPFNISQIWAAIVIKDEGTLSDDLAGLTFWAIIPVTFWFYAKVGALKRHPTHSSR